MPTIASEDVLRKIFAHSGSPSDLAKFCRVSQIWFYAASSVLWKDLEGIVNLFRTIPGVDISSHGQSDISGPNDHARMRMQSVYNALTINLPEGPDMSRFEYYASLIQYLSIFGRGAVPIRLGQRWEDLEIRYSTRSNSLFPRLLSLGSLDTNRYQVTKDWLRLISLFICPTLRDIRLSHHLFGHPRVALDDQYSSASIVSRLSSYCPELNTMYLLFDNKPLPVYAVQDWPRIHNLQRLMTDLDIIQNSSALLLVSQLPNIRVLGLYSRRAPAAAYVVPPLPDNAFPSISTLHLECSHPSMIQTVWSITQLVKPITQARIKVHQESNTTILHEWIDSALLSVSQKSANLYHLDISSHPFESLNDAPATFALLGSISLKTLKLDGFYVGFDFRPQEFALYVSKAEVLVLPSLRFDFEELYRFALNLPFLRMLSTQINYHYLPEGVKDISIVSHAPIIFILDSYDFVYTRSKKKFKQTVGIMYSMWPNMTFGLSEGSRHESETIAVRLLNEELSRLKRSKLTGS